MDLILAPRVVWIIISLFECCTETEINCLVEGIYQSHIICASLSLRWFNSNEWVCEGKRTVLSARDVLCQNYSRFKGGDWSTSIAWCWCRLMASHATNWTRDYNSSTVYYTINDGLILTCTPRCAFTIILIGCSSKLHAVHFGCVFVKRGEKEGVLSAKVATFLSLLIVQCFA